MDPFPNLSDLEKLLSGPPHELTLWEKHSIQEWQDNFADQESENFGQKPAGLDDFLANCQNNETEPCPYCDSTDHDGLNCPEAALLEDLAPDTEGERTEVYIGTTDRRFTREDSQLRKIEEAIHNPFAYLRERSFRKSEPEPDVAETSTLHISVMAAALINAIGFATIESIKLTPSAWVPTAVVGTAVTATALKQIWSAWQGNSKPMETITAQKLADLHAWEEAAAKSLVTAANKITADEELIKEVKEARDKAKQIAIDNAKHADDYKSQRDQWRKEKEKVDQTKRDQQKEIEDLTAQVNTLGKGVSHASPEAQESLQKGFRNIKDRLSALPASKQKDSLWSFIDTLLTISESNPVKVPSEANSDERFQSNNPFRPKTNSTASSVHNPFGNIGLDIFEHISDRKLPHAEYRNKSMDWEPENPHKFPTIQPAPDANRDTYIQMAEPFIYDGTAENWRSWYMACTLYFGAEHMRFRNRAEMPYVIINRIAAKTHASRFVQSLASRILKTGSTENIEYNQTLDGSFNCAQWILKKLKVVCWTNEFEQKLRNILHRPLGNRRFDHWILELEESMDQLDLPVAHVLPIAIEGLSHELKLTFSLAWQKSPEQFTWDDLTIKGPGIATMNYLRNREHHSYRDHHSPQHRTNPANNTVKANAGTTPAAGGNPYNTPGQNRQKRLSDEDFKILREGRGCFRCFWTGHTKENCKNQEGLAMTNNQRDKLRQNKRPAQAREGNAFVTSEELFNEITGQGSSTMSTPASSQSGRQ